MELFYCLLPILTSYFLVPFLGEEAALRTNQKREIPGGAPYQYIFQFDVPMNKPLPMKKPDPFDYIQGNLQSWL